MHSDRERSMVTSMPGPPSILGRRRFLGLLTRGGLGLAGAALLPRGVYAGGKASLDPATLTAMEFDVTYRTDVLSLPSAAREVRIWLPLPPQETSQDVAGLSVQCDRSHEVRVEERYGNRLAYVATDAAGGPFSLAAHYRIIRRREGFSKTQLSKEEAEKKYLVLASPVRATDEVVAFAANVVGKERAPLKVGRKIYDAIIDLLTYDKEIPGCGIGDTAWVMKYKRGKCDDYHALFMAMMVSRGIPVRWEQGFPLPYPSRDEVKAGGLSGDCTGAHCWASFHDPDVGWVPVDVSEGDKQPAMREFFFGKLTPNRFKVSEGRAIRLSPAQGGDPLPTFAFAYAESDGIPLIYEANYRNVIEYKITRFEVDREPTVG
jgi:transglutaminase-like putative cysteine protease